MESNPRVWIETLRRSHDRLAGLVAPLTPEQFEAQSYDTDWTVAQLLSHIGSGAEIGLIMLPGELGEAEPAGREVFAPVWETWNAKAPADQVADAVSFDQRLVSTLEGLSDDQLATMKMDFLGRQLDAAGIVGLRLGEHALHTWDLAAQHNRSATVPPDAAELLIDNVPNFLAPRLGKPLSEPLRVRIITTEPDRDYLLTSGDSVSVTDWSGDDGDVPVVRMPAEALLRLAYGRLDPEHTAAEVSGDPDVLAKLRKMFPGF